jgi:phage anti-repressor protein
MGMNTDILTDFSLLSAYSLTKSVDAFPVDFDAAWRWLGFSRRDSAKQSLLDCEFIKGVEFQINLELGTLDVPRPKEKIMLAVECFKSWGMMAGTEQGKQIRKYFIECERIAKRDYRPPTQLELAKQNLQLLEKEERQNIYLKDKPGLAHKIEEAHNPQKALPSFDLYTFDELCELRGVPLFDVNKKKLLSRKLADAYENDTFKKPRKISRVCFSPKGRRRNSQLNAYPLSILPTFDNLLKLR